MKKITYTLVAVLALFLLLAACAPAASPAAGDDTSPTAQDATAPENGDETPEAQQVIYRGRIDEVNEDGSILVTQLVGFDYGQPEISFIINDDTQLTPAADQEAEGLEVGWFVEVAHGGSLTLSIPPQVAASSVTVLSKSSEGVVVNGQVISVEPGEGSYRVSINLLNDNGDVEEDEAILVVADEAFENISPEQLAEGTKVSAVTTGVSTSSNPPQLPVHVLLPFTVAAAE